MSRCQSLTEPERRATVIMARWASEAGYRGLWWSVPNDASWPGNLLAGIAVRHDGLSSRYDLKGRLLWRPERVVCSLLRSPEGYRVEGVPGDEWLRPVNQVAFDPALTDPAARPEDDAPEDAEPADAAALLPGRSRPRLWWAAAVLVLAIPATTLGGVALTGSGDDRPDSPALPVADAPMPPAVVPPLPVAGAWWAQQAEAQRADAEGRHYTQASAEAAWAALPPDRRGDSVPDPVAELRAVRAELAAVMASAEADMAAWESLQGARTELVKTSGRLATVRRELARVAPAEAGALRAAEERLAGQEAVARERVAAGQRNVTEAMATPAPALPDAGTVPRITAAVHEVIVRPPEPGGQDQQESLGPPPVAAGREIEGDIPAQPALDPAPDPEPPEDPEEESSGGAVVADVPEQVVGDGSDYAPSPAPDPAPAADVNTQLHDQVGAETEAFLGHQAEIDAARSDVEGLTFEDVVRPDSMSPEALRANLTDVAANYPGR